MENQAFEEEQQPRVEETTSGSSNCPQTFAFQSITAGYLANTDSHVYEDILPGVEEVSKPKCSLQLSDDVVDRLSREDTARSFDGEELASPFRRNLTLPFRRDTGHGPFVTRCSVRATNRRRNVYLEKTATASGNAILVDDECAIAGAPSTALQTECKPNRKRRKKDCKHCRNKAATNDDRENETVLRKNRDNQQYHRQHYAIELNNPQMILDPRNLSDTLISSPVKRMNETEPVNESNVSSVFTISEKATDPPVNVSKLMEYERNDARQKFVKSTETEGNDAITSDDEKKTRAGMRVNSIYSQDRWYTKETPIFFTDVKEHDSFQRAYSLPLRTQTPSSQNRINLRRSVRGEPPPHPARLRKHRHGWTLHLARPLETSGCTRSLVFLLILLLTLVGIGAVALYLVFEPEKLHIIQQYLKSSTNDSSSSNTLLAGTFLHSSNGEETNGTTTTPANNTPVANILSSDDQSFPRNDTLLTLETETETETEATNSSNANSTRYCDDCLSEEVCVALVDEEVPICRISLDPQDPTGCAGFCLVNKQKCHRLDVDAFRCVDIEHYCLDDEWTCSNTLCIPVDKRCDGHMNCYDHSDEHNCVCDLETHFQCGNETSCLPLEKRCDGKIDCWDAADEINCTLACPSENEFTCSNGQCILKARFCDGLPDCLDGSDEPHGCQGRCNKHEFTCQNSRCIAKGMKCNGIDDCGDESDEKHCKDRIS